MGLRRALAGRCAALPYAGDWGANRTTPFAYSFDGQHIATVDGRNAILLKVGDSIGNAVILANDSKVSPISFSPEGDLLATGAGNQVRIWSRATGELLRTLQHSEKISALSFAPQGRLLGTGTHGGGLRIWDIETEEVRQQSGQHWVHSLSFSPDNRFVAFTTSRSLRVWDIGRGTLHGEPLDFGEHQIENIVQFGPAGKLVATKTLRGGPEKGQLWRIDADGVAPVADLGQSDAIAFSPDGTWLASIDVQDLTLHSLEAIRAGESMPPATTEVEAVGGTIFSRSLAFSPLAPSLLYIEKTSNTVTAYDVGRARFLDTPTDRRTHISAIAHALSGRHLYVAPRTRAALLDSLQLQSHKIPRDASDLFLISSAGTPGARSARAVRTVVDLYDSSNPITPTETRSFERRSAFLGADADGIVVCSNFECELQSLVTPVKPMPAMSRGVLSRGGGRIAWSDRFGNLRVLDTQSTTPPLELNISRRVTNLVMSRDASRLVTIGTEARKGLIAEIFRVTPERIESVSILEHRDVFTAAFARDGEQVITAGRESGLKHWDARTGERMKAPDSIGAFVRLHALSQDGTRIVAEREDGTLNVLRTDDGPVEGHPIRLDAESLSALAKDKDGWAMAVSTHLSGRTLVAIMQPVEDVLLFDHAHRELQSRIHVPDQTSHVVVHPDGDRVVTVSTAGTLRVWDVTSQRQIGKAREHGEHVRAVRFADNSSIVLTRTASHTYVWKVDQSSWAFRQDSPPESPWPIEVNTTATRAIARESDGSAKLITLDPKAEILGTLGHRESTINRIGFGPGGRLAFTVAGTEVRLWDADSAEPFGKPLKHDLPVDGAWIGPGGTVVVTRSDNHMYAWDPATGLLRTRPLIPPGHVVGFSDDANLVAIPHGHDGLRIWDVASGVSLTPPLHPHAGVVGRTRFDPGSSWVESITDTHVHRWKIPPPLPEPNPRLEASIERRTQLTLNHLGNLRHLGFHEVLKRTRTLEAEGGPNDINPTLRLGSVGGVTGHGWRQGRHRCGRRFRPIAQRSQNACGSRRGLRPRYAYPSCN